MTAAEVLLKSGCCSLPVDLNAAAAANDVKLISYDDCTRLYDMRLEEIYSQLSHLGFSFFDDGFVCAINEKACGKLRRRWTTAHELGHVFLGHISDAELRAPARYEQEADCFAAELLAPLCVLHFCGVSSAEELAHLTMLSKQASEIRMKQLTELRRRHSENMRCAAMQGTSPNCGVLLPDESSADLLRSFLPFIAEYITRKCGR